MYIYIWIYTYIHSYILYINIHIYIYMNIPRPFPSPTPPPGPADSPPPGPGGRPSPRSRGRPLSLSLSRSVSLSLSSSLSLCLSLSLSLYLNTAVCVFIPLQPTVHEVVGQRRCQNSRCLLWGSGLKTKVSLAKPSQANPMFAKWLEHKNGDTGLITFLICIQKPQIPRSWSNRDLSMLERRCLVRATWQFPRLLCSKLIVSCTRDDTFPNGFALTLHSSSLVRSISRASHLFFVIGRRVTQVCLCFPEWTSPGAALVELVPPRLHVFSHAYVKVSVSCAWDYRVWGREPLEIQSGKK